MTVAPPAPVHYALRDVLLDDGPCVHDESPVLDGALLLDDGWLLERMADTARRWCHDDPRVSATLWWYSASATLTGPAADALLRGVPAPSPEAANLRMTLRRNGHVGYLARTRSRYRVPGGPLGYGEALARDVAPVIEKLARLGGANPRSLWSVFGDSLAGRLLAYSGAARHDIAHEVALGTGGLLPRPRYACAGGKPYVRRGSCCLIFAVPDHGKCSNCPRQTPETRALRVLA
jgi:ferric iron reductase protein FhuF